MKMYNHLYDIGFTVESKEEDSIDVHERVILQGLLRRVADLLVSQSEGIYGDLLEAIGHCDTYLIEGEEDE